MSLPNNETVDCVDVHRQHGSNVRLAEIPTAPTNAPPQATTAAPQLRQVYDTATDLCPEGTVPRRRVTLDDLRRFRNLDDFFRKVPSHISTSDLEAPPKEGPTADHQYARGYQYVDNWGIEAALNIWSPYVELSSEFSLSQIWAVRGGDGAPALKQTVEAGWQVSSSKYGDSNARLFVYFTTNNYGSSGGCYNLDCTGFVQTSNLIMLGGSFATYSSHNGPQYELKLLLFKDLGNGSWWFRFGDTWLGYWPRELFNDGGLADHAGKIAIGGEIVNGRSGGRHTATDMGSGWGPAYGFGNSAYERAIRYVQTGTAYAQDPSLTAQFDSADCYGLSAFAYSSDASWGRYFYYGGGGYNANCE